MRPMRRTTLRSATETISRASGVSGPSTPPERRPSEPRIEVSGVRSSWLTVETNSRLSRSTSCRCVTSTTLPATRRPRGPSNWKSDSSNGKTDPSLRRPSHSVTRPRDFSNALFRCAAESNPSRAGTRIPRWLPTSSSLE